MLLADVIMPVPLPQYFTYIVPDELVVIAEPGKRVVAPFGKRKLISGIIRALRKADEGIQGVKMISAIPDDAPLVSEKVLQFWDWLASYYMCSPGEVMTAAIPSSFRLESETRVMIHPQFNGDTSVLSDKEYLVFEALGYSDSLTIREVTEIVGTPRVMNMIYSLLAREIIVSSETIIDNYKEKTVKVVKLAESYSNDEMLEKLINSLSSAAFKQLEMILSFLAKAGPEYKTFQIEKKSLLNEKGSSTSAFQSLIKKGVFVEEQIVVSRLGDFAATKSAENLELSKAQADCLNSVKVGFSQNKPVLLHGITGSGKTEIYISLINEVLEKGNQVLYILPEIALTSQIINRLRIFFGNRVQVFHSRYSALKKAELWNKIVKFTGAQDDPYVLVGARSALFLPLTDLGLIIVDEEHDHSFKQYDPAPRYQARDSAVMLAHMLGIPIVMGSATPAVESYRNAVVGKYHLVTLEERYGNSVLPKVIVADLNQARKEQKITSHYSQTLIDEIKSALNDKMQVIVFQNRRGFSYRIVCDICRWSPGCPQCDVSLTYHKGIHKLKCHYCGFQTHVPSACPECESKIIKTVGFGTEKVEEELISFFPEASIRRMDYDTTRTQDGFQRIIDDFEAGAIDVLIGTQMVTKGLDFSNVALVGVLDADSMIAFPDFRSTERSFHHLVQVSGRAGRSDNQGTVVIQTWQPHNELIRLAHKHNYLGFYNHIIDERKNFEYPPFVRLVRIVCKAKDYGVLDKASDYLAKECRKNTGLKVLGPELPLIPRIKNMYIRHILIKLPFNINQSKAKQVISKIIMNMNHYVEWRKVRFVVDVDPY